MSVTALPSPVIGSLSPSRAADFKTCPLQYRFRRIDRLPEQPSPAATRGTLVHGVLERLFDLPARDRTLAAAEGLLLPEWDRLREVAPELDELYDDADELTGWLASARDLIETYFALEDPAWVEPTERELLLEAVLEGGLLLRGVIDRLDVAPTGEIRVVDYKTGFSPGDAFEGRALFQMKFYALLVWRVRGVIPRQLRLIYLGDCDTLSYVPHEEELVRFERNLLALWEAIARATETGDFQPNPGRVCDWCDHKARCPAWGGTPPPFPAGELEPAPELTASVLTASVLAAAGAAADLRSITMPPPRWLPAYGAVSVRPAGETASDQHRRPGLDEGGS